MKTVPYDPKYITKQKHTDFQREGWDIFNYNEVQRIDDPDAWGIEQGFKPLLFKDDDEAVLKAQKHGFIVKDYLIAEIILKDS